MRRVLTVVMTVGALLATGSRAWAAMDDVKAAGDAVAVAPPVASIDSSAFEAQYAQTDRPKPLIGLYASAIALHGVDIWTTQSALKRGGVEANPSMRARAGTQLLVKTSVSVATIVVAERLWKTNKAAAIATMVVTNGFLATVVAHNAALKIPR